MFGIHYQEQLQHWMGWITKVNYKSVLQNNSTHLFSKFIPTFFSATYFSPMVSELIEDFNFRTLKLKTVNNVGSNVLEESFRIRNTIFLDTAQLILDSNETYDYVLLTRYDLFFKYSPLTTIDTDKITLLCRAKWGTAEDLVDDNFYFMPYSKLKFFCEIVWNIPVTVSSHTYEHYFPPTEFSYVVEGKFYSHEIPIYHIQR